MAVRSVVATETPTAVPDMTVGVWFAVQNQSTDTTLHLAGATAAPSRGDPAFVQPPFGTGQVKANPGDQVFIWAGKGSALAVYDEAE